MRILLQRAARAEVRINGKPVGAIGQGLLLLVGIGAEDETDDGAALPTMARKILGLRIFSDDAGKMNCSVEEIGGGILVVSQFTLHADCRKGRRPSFTEAACPEFAREAFDRFVGLLKTSGLKVETGVFGAMMEVELVNDGPVTIWLDSAELKSGTGVSPVILKIDPQRHTEGIRIRYGANLPHWTAEWGIYYVTFRLCDSMPQSVLQAWRAEREGIVENLKRQGHNPSVFEEGRLDKLYSERVENYLDAGCGACWMKDPKIAAIVAGALKHFDSSRYDLAAWCVMPNHVHAVLRPLPGYDLAQILHSWKSFTTKECNKALGRAGSLWQEESYDHLVRDHEDFLRVVRYTIANPEKAGLKEWEWVGGIEASEES